MRCLIVCVCLVSLLVSAAGADWLSVPNAPVADYVVVNGSRAADGTSWFVAEMSNAADVVSAKWTVAGLGVFDVYVNGQRIGDDFLKPGFTHYAKTKYSFSYDVVGSMRKSKDAVNHFAAEVSAGWWRDKILTPTLHEGVGEAHIGFTGKKSAFRGVLELSYADGSKRILETNTNDWRCAIGGPVTHAAIFDGEDFDARIAAPVCGGREFVVPQISTEFKGQVLPSDGAEICLRHDLAMEKRGVRLVPGVTNVIDFGQNCAAVPAFRFRAKPGTVLCVLPAEMLNADGTVYRDNLREIKDTGALVHYTFRGGNEFEEYMPRFTYFGYRYLAMVADGDVEIESVRSIPVSSIRKDMEIGKLEVGDPSLNRFIRNVYWSQLSNYLSVPTDCPQRNERLGWSADTQVFCEAGAYTAFSYDFLRKWMRDMCDSRDDEGGFPSVAPFSQYGNETFLFGWADAGVVVPYRMWKMFGDTRIVQENFEAMAKFVRKLEETKYDFEGSRGYIFADWLSTEKFETRGNRFGDWTKWRDDPEAMEYRRFLAACYWLYDARMMVEMAESIGNAVEADWFRGSSERALAFIRGRFVANDGLLLESMRELQTACVFALRFGIVSGDAKAATLALLKKSIADHDGCLQTGFLGTSFLMDVLADANEFDVAYGLLFQHKCPSWLYSVDQGATTVWERWNSYVKGVGFGPVDMNSFNHYAYGAVIAWIYRRSAGIAADPSVPGFKRIVLSPKPDRRLGYVKAEYRSAAGLIRSAWHYEGEKWIWEFTVPDGATATVTVPGERSRPYVAGTYRIER